MVETLFLVLSVEEKKNEEARIPSAAHASATVCWRADLPDPAGKA